MITSHVDGDQIEPGNIVIYRPVDSSVKADIAEIQSSNLSDGVYSYYARDKLGNELFLVYSQIIGKGMSYSDFLGAVIRFLSSPGGLLAVAVIPCCVLIGFEFFQLAQKRSDADTVVKTIKKQNEVPTFVSSSNKEANSPRRAAGKGNAPLFTSPMKKGGADVQRSSEILTPAERINRAIAETRLQSEKQPKNEGIIKKEPATDLQQSYKFSGRSSSAPVPHRKQERSGAVLFEPEEEEEIMDERAAVIKNMRSQRSERESAAVDVVNSAERTQGNKEPVFEQREEASGAGWKMPDLRGKTSTSGDRERSSKDARIKLNLSERISDSPADVIEYIPKRQQRETPQRETPQRETPQSKSPLRRVLETPRQRQRSHSYLNAVPSLDKLLADERSAEKNFSIDEILASIENKNE